MSLCVCKLFFLQTLPYQVVWKEASSSSHNKHTEETYKIHAVKPIKTKALSPTIKSWKKNDHKTLLNGDGS